MERRILGRTGLEVSEVSVGTEHLLREPAETTAAVIGRAIDGGVNYFDVVFSHAHYLDNLGAAFRGRRERLLLTGHLGSTVYKDQYRRTDSPKKSEEFFLDLLTRLGTEYVDVLFLHNFNSAREWDVAAKAGGRLELACRLRDEGKARFLGISGHNAEVMKSAVDSGQVDVVMYPMSLLSHAQAGRTELQELCVRQDVALVAMKPYGGGRLLTNRGTVRVAKYQTGGESYTVRFPEGITPARCVSYTLAQVGVSTALVGVRTPEEVATALQILEAGAAERDFAPLVAAFGRYVEGECVYCNHCLPCPVQIDIAATMRLLDAAQPGVTLGQQLEYEALAVKAAACTGCTACEQRCPFGVEVIDRMKQAAALFGS